MAKPIVKLLLPFLLVIAGLGSDPRPLLAQNPAPVVQSAGTIRASAQVVSSEMIFVWHGVLADSAGVVVETRPGHQLSPMEIRAQRAGVLIVTEQVDPRSDRIDDPVTPPAERSRLRVSLMFTAN